MTDIERTDIEREELQRSLALAKNGLRAPLASRERVRARLAAGAVTPVVASRLARAPGQAFVRAALWVGLGVGVGYWLGFHHIGFHHIGFQRVGAGLGEVGESVSERDPAPVAAFAAPSLEPRGSDPPSGASSSAAPSSSGASSAASSSSEATSAAAATPAPSSAHRSASAPPPARRRPEPRAMSNLGAEVALLERAERAIRAGEGDLALALLDDLDQKFPVSPLREERAAAHVLAACVNTRSSSTAARESAQAAARHLLAHGSSLYADRVRQLCELGDENASPSSKETSEPGH